MLADANKPHLQPDNSAPRKRSRFWFYYALLLIVACGFLYYNYTNTKDSFINIDFYRILYEASTRFNQNLDQLDRMHQYEESLTSRRSLLPSYKVLIDRPITDSTEATEVKGQETGDNLLEPGGQTDEGSGKASNRQAPPGKDWSAYRFSLGANKVLIEKGPLAKPTFKAEVDVVDLLSDPDNAVSLYLFADDEGQVLASVGLERTISVVDLTNINQALLKQKRQLEAFINNKSTASGGSRPPPLPSYSSHVDINLSYGDFRVYLFPFTLLTPLEKDQTDKQHTTLFLVGLVPASNLGDKNSGHWNIPLLVATLVSLVFLWSMLRLFLLPKNQTIGLWFRATTMVSSFSFFLVLVALLIAYLFNVHLRFEKDLAAQHYAAELREGLEQDLYQVFGGLQDYRGFYKELLNGVEHYAKTRKSELDTYQNRELDTLIETQTDALKDKQTSLTKTQTQELTETAKQLSLNWFNKAQAPTDMSSYVLNAVRSINDVQDADSFNWTPSHVFTSSLAQNICIAPSCEANPLGAQQLDMTINQALISPAVTSASGMPSTGFTAGYLNVKHAEDSIVTHVKESINIRLPHNILTVFAVDMNGNTSLPPIYYQEQNAPPVTFNLSHRDYYKQVRDRQAWLLPGKPEPFSLPAYRNIYVQRLLNINDGTRGTTVSMLLSDGSQRQGESYQVLSPEEVILGADVIFPSLSLAPAPQKDFVYMVVNRNSGDVMFHSDESRTLIENLFIAGHHKSQLSDWIRSGLDEAPHLTTKVFKGHYHGQAGRFSLTNTPIDAWSIVVFYPDNSLEVLMANQFLYIFASLGLLMMAIALVTKLVRSLFSSDYIKKRLHLQLWLDSKTGLFIVSILLSFYYLLFHLDLLFDLAANDAGNRRSIAPLGIAGIVLLFVLYRFFIEGKNAIKTLLPWVVPAVVLLPILWGVNTYLQRTAQLPFDGLTYHYQQRHCSWLNHERQEVKSLAISRFPNSVTLFNHNPYDLLPLPDEWKNQVKDPNHALCRGFSGAVVPEDLPSLNSITGVSNLWSWVNQYLLHNGAKIEVPNASLQLKPGTQLWFGLLSMLSFILWWLFHNKVLLSRLYCRPEFLFHIKTLSEYLRRDHARLSFQQRSERLRVKHNMEEAEGGVELMSLIQQCATLPDDVFDEKMPTMAAQFKLLYQCSPQLQRLAGSEVFFTNIKIAIKPTDKQGAPDIQLWEFETCLQDPVLRDELLVLINEFSALTREGIIHTFTLISRFRGLQRIKSADTLEDVNSLEEQQADYLAWAECLMDFSFELPEQLYRDANKTVLQREIDSFPELSYLSPKFTHTQHLPVISPLRNKTRTRGHWAAINAILLLAEPLYRIKWESCSTSEKLALYHLANRAAVNPDNTQMIEHLAMQGLLKVDGGDIRLMNESFTQFVLNAETEASLHALSVKAQAGAWKNYRFPIGIMILLLIGGVALTSGESIYIIAASLAGVMGTIASVTSSANLLKGQLNK